METFFRPYSKTCPPRRTIVIRKNNTTSPPSTSAMARDRLRRSRALRCSISFSSISHPVSQRRDADQPFADQSREQDKEIKDGNAEQLARLRLLRRVALEQNPDRAVEKPGADRHRACQIERAGKPHRGGRKADRKQ